MSALPSKDSIAGTGGSAPSNATARTGFGALWDYLNGLFGSTGTAADARAALAVAGTAGATFTGGINEARGTIAMHATTMDLWAKPNVIDGTGSAVTITDIADAPQAGAQRTLYPVAGTVITDGATFDVDGGANYTTAAGDALIFEAVTTSTFKVHIVKADGTSIVGTAAATQAQMESASSNTVTATPGNLHFHPGIPKYIGFVNGATGAITNIYSASGTPTASRTGSGQYTIASMALSGGGGPFLQSIDADRVAAPFGITGNGFNVTTRVPGGANGDASFYFTYYGDL